MRLFYQGQWADLLSETQGELLSLQWPAPPRNILLVRKDCAPAVTDSLIEFVKYAEFALEVAS